MFNKIIALTFVLLFSPASYAVTVDINGDPFTLEQGSGPLALSATLTDTVTPGYFHRWSIEGVNVSGLEAPVLSWLEIAAATGGAPGLYTIALNVTNAPPSFVCRQFPRLPGCISPDEGVATANLTITSPIPVPAAVWLFGTALIGLIGISRRRKVG